MTLATQAGRLPIKITAFKSHDHSAAGIAASHCVRYLPVWLAALFLFIVTIASCVAVEAVCVALADRPAKVTLSDNSAVLTGWLMAASLPPWSPWWIGLLGAISLSLWPSTLFGGLGQNVFNPAMVGRTVLLVSFPVIMTSWVLPHPLFSAGAPGFSDAIAITFGGHMPDTVSAASALGYVKPN